MDRSSFNAGILCLALAMSLSPPDSGVRAATTAGARIAVTDFSVAAPGDGNLPAGTTLADMLTRELVLHRRVRVLERTLIKKILAEKKLAMAGITSGGAATTGALLGVDYILGGNLLPHDDELEINSRLIDARTGVIVATESIQYDKDDEQRLVLQNLAAMLGHNFTAAGDFTGKEKARGVWEPFTSKKSQSRFEADGENGGTWSYKIRKGDDEYTGLSFYPEIHKIRDRKILITCRTENGYPVYLRFYSFVPGFSRKGDEDSLVPVEELLPGATVTTETEASYLKMQVPEWWRREHRAQKEIRFNPDDIRQIEFEATEETAEKSGKDKIEIFRIAFQKIKNGGRK